MTKACTFFGHRDCPDTIKPALRAAILSLVKEHGVTMFYVGNSGHFDAYCRSTLRELGVNYAVVLYRIPPKTSVYEDYSDTMLPESVEAVPPKFAIDRRNCYLVDNADICLCYINHTWGGAYKFARMAKHRGLQVINLGSATIA